jgi:purine-binding chemotaxis protein CheW
MTATKTNQSSETSQTSAGKYLTFVLAGESYGIPVLKVREIIKLVPVTVVPQMPSYIKGVLNLRGRIIPVVDMRVKFGMGEPENTDHTCIVVVQVMSAARTTISLGLVVDSVEEVSNIAATDIESTPDFGTTLDTSYLVGMAKIKGKVVSLLNIDRCLGASELEAVQQTVGM